MSVLTKPAKIRRYQITSDMFKLTREQQLLIAALLAIFLTGLAVKACKARTPSSQVTQNQTSK